VITDAESYRLKKKYGAALRRIITENTPSKRFIGYLGLSTRAFRAVITAQLKPQFTLSNYGRIWALDHVVPVFLFDQKNPDDLAICWNYINIMPMPLLLNRLKGVSLEFALRELALRKTWPASHAVAPLKQRLVDFVESLHSHHSTATPEALQRALNLG
jgi:hypothetical protein